MTLRSLLSTIALVFTVLAADARACSCGRLSLCQTAARTDAVFLGRVVSVDDAPGRVITIQVLELFSGAAEDTIEVVNGTASGDCSVRFRAGEEWIVFANRNAKTGRYGASLCSGTSPRNLSRDLEPLRAAAASKPRIFGRVLKQSAPLMGTIVTLRSGHATRETRADEQGNYEFNDVEPGDYSVAAAIDDRLDGGAARPVKIGGKACGEVIFTAVGRGIASGRVVDDSGAPVATQRIFLAPRDTSSKVEVQSAYTKADGTYRIARIEPGEYLLSINALEAPHAGRFASPYPPTYYPGVPTPERALSIEFNNDEVKDGLDLPLPARLQSVTVLVRAAWPDGTPARGAMVTAIDDETNQQAAWEFSPNYRVFLNLLGGRRYRLIAATTAPGNSVHGHSEPILATPTAYSEIRAVLTLPGQR